MTQVTANDLTAIISDQTIELYMLKRAYNQLVEKNKSLEDAIEKTTANKEKKLKSKIIQEDKDNGNR